MTRLRSQASTGSRIKLSSVASFTVQTAAGLDFGWYPSRERAMSAARWAARRSGERVSVLCARTGQVWGVSPAGA
jgi:hypothetical protein